MESWKQYPLLKVGCALAGGILLHRYHPGMEWIFAGTGALLWASAAMAGKRALPVWDVIASIGILGVFVGMGSAFAAMESERTRPDWTAETRFEGWVEGVVVNDPRTTRKGWSCQLDIEASYADSQWTPVRERVLAYLPQDVPMGSRFDRFRVHLNVKPVTSTLESYVAYLASEGIVLQAYVQAGEKTGVETGTKHFWWTVQQRISQQIRVIMPDTVNAAIASAMFLGDKSHLPREVKAHFAQSGLSHVLAISGMHIGAIYVLLTFLLGLLGNLPGQRFWKNGLILLMLLAYLALTGASPAVLRAVVMFSAVLIFKMCHSRFRTLNVLAIPGVFHLVLEPSVLFQPGFQLSYLAVIGIVAGMPYFQKFTHTGNKIWDSCVDAVGVTLCASLATGPLVWIHFGTFPSHFLLTNLVATPIAAILTFSGFLMVFFAYVPGVNVLLSDFTSHLLTALQVVSSESVKLPYAAVGAWRLSDPGFAMMLMEVCGILAIIFLPRMVQLAARRYKLVRMNRQAVWG
jgi:competence protein ComEC